MNGNITQNKVKTILKNKDSMLLDIDRKIAALVTELSNDDMIKERCLSAVKLSQTSSKGCDHGDLSDVIIDIEEHNADRRKELSRLIIHLNKQKKEIDKVWAGFLLLDEPYYDVINKLYVENGQYYNVQNDLKLSEGQFERYRKKGILMIISYVESRD